MDKFEMISNLDYRGVIILCIGTPKVILDSFGPRLGSLLKSKTNLEVYGTLDTPIHALNIREFLSNFEPTHKTVIAIDASVGSLVGDIKIRNSPLNPGRGVGSSLPTVGDYAITCTTVESQFDILCYSGCPATIDGYVQTTFNMLINTFGRDILK